MIFFTHHTGEPHGILGAQLAATFFEQDLSISSIVVGIERSFSKERLFRFIEEHYAGKERIVAFSHLCGRKDLIELVLELKRAGFRTILGGPQAGQDYVGEPEADSHPHRFRGLRALVDLAFQGPVDGFATEHLHQRGALFEYPWSKDISSEVDWSNLYLFSESLRKHEVRLGQVLNAIGCPYASKTQTVTLPPPTELFQKGIPELNVRSQGCIFCDVSHDKGFHGLLEAEQVIDQIVRLPELDGKKIPFELIDEYPLRSLRKLLEEIGRQTSVFRRSIWSAVSMTSMLMLLNFREFFRRLRG